VLAVGATRILCSQGRRRAFFLGFTVVCAAHLAGFPGLLDRDRIYRTISLDLSAHIPKSLTVSELTYMAWPVIVLVTSAVAGLACALVWPAHERELRTSHDLPAQNGHSDDMA
jgi:hypothetical protein